MNLDKEFHKSNQYRYSVLIALLSVLLGLILQYFLGSIPKSWFSFPQNIVGGLAFVLLNTAIFFLFKKKNFINLHSSTPFAIVTVITLGLLTIGLGSISVDKGHHQTSPLILQFGLDDITKTWYFALVFLMALTNLWLAILKRSVVYQAKNITFLLNHFGLWLVMFAGVLGQGDLIRLKMDLRKDQIEWRATDDYGNVIQLPIAMELKSFDIDIYPNKLFVIDSLGNSLPKSKPEGFMLEKDGSEGKIMDWKITQHTYYEKAVPESDSTYVSHGMWGATNAAFVTVENLKTGVKKQEWISAGNFQLPPRTIELDAQHTLVMAPAEARKFQSEVVIYQKNTEQVRNEKIEVNHPVKVDGWKVYQVSYDERMGRWSDLSVVELVLDPWLPVVYTGIFILMAGGIAFLLTNRK
ncbi:cytochrome c biogenesis protein ResB [Capnocytophaga felis]|uniref:Membrane protein n=1 Tax=Capnocytophaga felis TaxID=2267611 RepID=A0A5M4B869_9FLAO|nr:cytochrome c biogenesis protein ResB [Capnocytophaga felis]GET45793.1 membrane protein [Capnocytophaga felis]GET48062.1 membrane protein [Capnocytophaga felis]